ncbi:MAG: prepilin-type N-terminal cleavage/methylation domain-containing protein [Myxococcales bacterium]|nr:prepilin-type N-terminal cleavage/methylation domain-containing protein [Myxococcales bacterium]
MNSPTQPHTRRPAATTRRSRAGFTLLEIMVALTIGAMAVGSIYAVGKNSNHYFQQQYRVTNSMTALRLAMAQVKRDLQRAGYLATPNAAVDGTCGTTGVTPGASNYAGVMRLVQAFGDAGNSNGMDPGGNYPGTLPADTVWLLGNYETNTEYAGLQDDTGMGTDLSIPQSYHAFRRDFTTWHDQTNPNVIDMAYFNQVFTVGRPVRIKTSGSGRFHFAVVAAVNPPVVPGGNVRIRISPPVPPTCRPSINKGWIAPLKVLEYTVIPRLANGVVNSIGYDPNDPERYPQLHRREIDVGTGAPFGIAAGGDDEIVLDYVVTFDLDFIAANPILPGMPETIDWNPDNGVVAGRPHDLRMARVTLRTRSPGLDPSFPAPVPENAEPFRRFILDPGPVRRQGSARVRTLRADIFLPNVAIND